MGTLSKGGFAKINRLSFNDSNNNDLNDILDELSVNEWMNDETNAKMKELFLYKKNFKNNR